MENFIFCAVLLSIFGKIITQKLPSLDDKDLLWWKKIHGALIPHESITRFVFLLATKLQRVLTLKMVLKLSIKQLAK